MCSVCMCVRVIYIGHVCVMCVCQVYVFVCVMCMRMCYVYVQPIASGVSFPQSQILFDVLVL